MKESLVEKLERLFKCEVNLTEVYRHRWMTGHFIKFSTDDGSVTSLNLSRAYCKVGVEFYRLRRIWDTLEHCILQYILNARRILARDCAPLITRDNVCNVCPSGSARYYFIPRNTPLATLRSFIKCNSVHIEDSGLTLSAFLARILLTKLCIFLRGGQTIKMSGIECFKSLNIPSNINSLLSCRTTSLTTSRKHASVDISAFVSGHLNIFSWEPHFISCTKFQWNWFMRQNS